jgi:hypothetical protein
MIKTLLIDSAESAFYTSSFLKAQGTRRKIKGFMHFDEGWSYGYGEKFNLQVVEEALALHTELIRIGISKTDAFPGLSGEVMVTGYYHNHYLEFIVEPDLTITFTHEVGDDEVFYQEGLSTQQAITHLREFYQWMQYEFLIKNTIMTEKGEGSKASLLEILEQKTLASPSSAKNVYLKREDRFVNISESITPQSLENLLFSGDSQQRYFHLVTS